MAALLACETREQCPVNEPGVRWGCHAVNCGAKHCRTADPPCAAPDRSALVCGCDGLTAEGYVGCGTGFPPSYAYALPGYWCTRGAEGCEGPSLLGLACDPLMPPEAIVQSFVGSGLTDLEGVQLVVRAYNTSDLLRVVAGSAELALPNVNASTSFEFQIVIDENEDGLCSDGELALPHSVQLDALAWHVQFVVMSDKPRPSCSAW
jgi:hypothetical protein